MQVKVGQIWKDNDPRRAGRLIKVMEIEKNLNMAECLVVASKKVVKIKLERFCGSERKGYSLRWDR